MIARYLLSVFTILMLAGCVTKPQSDEISQVKGLPSDSVWVVVKGQYKTDVRNCLVLKGMRVEDNNSENSIIGISPRSIRWVGTDWDIAYCRFNAENRLSSVSVMRSGKFDNGDVSGDSIYSVLYELQRVFGMAKAISSEKWQFINTEHVNASITQDSNTTIDVIWE